jgi:hypothetical protein
MSGITAPSSTTHPSLDPPKVKAFVLWYGWDRTAQLMVYWIVIVYSGLDRFKSGLLWNYPTIDPQSGTGTA